MGASPVLDFKVRSYQGDYEVFFRDQPFEGIEESAGETHYLVDEKVSDLYRSELKSVLQSRSCLLITANEENKSFNRLGSYIEHLIEKGVKKNHRLVAIGGGILQDITCFLASVLFRGLRW